MCMWFFLWLTDVVYWMTKINTIPWVTIFEIDQLDLAAESWEDTGPLGVHPQQAAPLQTLHPCLLLPGPVVPKTPQKMGS